MLEIKQSSELAVKKNKAYYTLHNKKLRFSFNSDKVFLPIISIITLIYILLLIAPIVSLGKFSGIENIMKSIESTDNLGAIKLSMITSFVVIIFTFILGTPTVFYLKEIKNNKVVKVLDIILEIPIVLPPAVAGIGLILTFGTNSFIGGFLNAHNLNIIFTPYAVIIAQFFVSAAFYVRILRNAVELVPKEIFEAAYICGANKVQTIVFVILPMLKKSLVSGLMLGWIRALGEFGATTMFAGNVLNKTRTMPLQIYTLMQSDIKMAASFSMILYIITFVILVIIRVFLKEQNTG